MASRKPTVLVTGLIVVGFVDRERVAVPERALGAFGGPRLRPALVG
jgi:hypothetical protein